jgi:hypothetical protein
MCSSVVDEATCGTGTYVQMTGTKRHCPCKSNATEIKAKYRDLGKATLGICSPMRPLRYARVHFRFSCCLFQGPFGYAGHLRDGVYGTVGYE